MTFFVMALGAAPCSGAEDPKAKSTKQNQRPQATSQKTTAKPVSAFPPELASPEKWAQFKALWEELNAVEPKPKKDDKRPHAESQPYRQTITAEQALKWQSKLANCLGLKNALQVQVAISRTYQHLAGVEWKDNPDIKTLSIPMLALAKVTLDRIRYMEGDKRKDIRMAMPIAHLNATLMEHLEKRIDTLAALRKKGIIKGKEFATAHRAIQNDIYLHAVMGVFDGKPRISFQPVAKPISLIGAKPVRGGTRMSRSRAIKLARLRALEQRLLCMDKRIANLKARKQVRDINAPEFAVAMAKLQKEKRNLLYFAPVAWLNGYKQATDNYINRQPPQQGQTRKSAEINKEKYRQAYRQVRAVFDRLQKSRPRVDAAVKELEKPG